MFNSSLSRVKSENEAIGTTGDTVDTSKDPVSARRFTFHAYSVLYHLPLYSRASTSNKTVNSSIIFMSNSFIRSSPNTSKHTFLGYASCVSITNSWTIHALPDNLATPLFFPISRLSFLLFPHI